MSWQDLVLTAGSLFFSIALLPTVLDRSARVPRATSLTTAFWLVVFAATQWTLDLRMAPIFEVACAGCWLFIAARRAPAAPPRPGPRLTKNWRDTNIHRLEIEL
jgi:hypothetical protein